MLFLWFDCDVEVVVVFYVLVFDNVCIVYVVCYGKVGVYVFGNVEGVVMIVVFEFDG